MALNIVYGANAIATARERLASVNQATRGNEKKEIH
jgi:hypothetical protein